MEEKIYSVSYERFIADNDLEAVYLPDLPQNLTISSTRVNRPGLQFAGYLDHFDYDRVQLIASAVMHYLYLR